MNNGVLLRLCRSDVPIKNYEDSNGVTNKRERDIGAFLHIDSIQCYPVTEFSDYDCLPKNEDNNWIFDYERRKVNLYFLEGMEPVVTENNRTLPDIFEEDRYGAYPVMFITLFEFDFCKINKKSVYAKITSIKENSNGFAMECFGCLSMADLVVVIRAENYHSAHKALQQIYGNGEIYIKTCYTIPAFFKGLGGNWESESELEVSIQVSLRKPSSDAARDIYEKIEGAGVFDFGDDSEAKNLAYSLSLGKFDIEIRGKIKNTTKFHTLFFGSKDDANNYLSEASEYFQKNILLTNTQFLWDGKVLDQCVVPPIPNEATACGVVGSSNCDEKNSPSPDISKKKDDLRKFINVLNCKNVDDPVNKYLSETEKTTLKRLWSRINYVSNLPYFSCHTDLFKLGYVLWGMAMTQISVRDNPNAQEVTNNLSDFMQFAYWYVENRYMSIRRDFESQDKFNMSYGESARLFSAYIELSHDIVTILEEARKDLPGAKSSKCESGYNFFPVPVLNSSVKLEVFKYSAALPKIFYHENAKKLIHDKKSMRVGFFKLPTEQTYDIADVIAVFLHEAGHMYRVCRPLRNADFIERLLPKLLQFELVDNIKKILKEKKLNLGKSDEVINSFFSDVFGNRIYARSIEDGDNFDARALWDSICAKCKGNASEHACDCTNCKDLGFKYGKGRCGKRFADIAGCIKNWINAYLPKMGTHPYLTNSELHISEMASDIVSVVDTFCGTWDEALADIMLVELLVLDADGYMDVMKSYLKKTKRGIDLYFAIRIFAVCMYMDKNKGIKDEEEIKAKKYSDHSLFRDCKDTIIEDQYWMHIYTYADILSGTLGKLLKESYGKTLEIESIKAKIEKIRIAYNACKVDSETNTIHFSSAIKFIDAFINRTDGSAAKN